MLINIELFALEVYNFFAEGTTLQWWTISVKVFEVNISVRLCIVYVGLVSRFCALFMAVLSNSTCTLARRIA